MIDLANIGEKLKAFRKKHGVRMSVIAALTGIPADRMYKWESGVTPYQTPGVDALIKILEADKIPEIPKNILESSLKDTVKGLENIGMRAGLLNLSKVQLDALAINQAAESKAQLDALARIIANQENKPFETVRNELVSVTLDKQQKVVLVLEQLAEF